MQTRVQLLERVTELEAERDRIDSELYVMTQEVKVQSGIVKSMEESSIAAEGKFDFVKSELAQGRQAQDELRSERDIQIRLRTIAEKKLEEERGENAQLRDQLHHMTMENARQQGYRERVEHFDPVTDQQQYLDQVRPMHRTRDFAGGGVMANGEERRPRWYRRG